MLALLACAPSDAGTILPSTLEGSQKSDALAGCRFALDGRLWYIRCFQKPGEAVEQTP